MSNTQKTTSDESLTHPQAYRDSVNGKVTPTIKKCDEFPCESKSANENEKDWDLYPQVIRQIENQGSEQQVDELHEIEKKCQS